jgi:hypothetical protein
MTRTPSRAHGIIDPDTGNLLAITSRSVTWVLHDGTRLDATPDHSWEVAAAGGGGIALAGEGWLTWRGSAEPVQVEATGAYRVAVAGQLVAAVTVDGELLVWPDIGATADTLNGRVTFEPEGAAWDPGTRRLVVWGWLTDGAAEIAMFAISADGLVAVRPDIPWPAPAGGMAFPLRAGSLAVATTGMLTIVGPDGQPRGGYALPGVELLAGSGGTVAWIRVPDAEGRPVVGAAQLVGDDIRPLVELPMPGKDPFPHLAVAPGGTVLVVGTGTYQLTLHRLNADGWAEPTRYSLPRRAPT